MIIREHNSRSIDDHARTDTRSAGHLRSIVAMKIQTVGQAVAKEIFEGRTFKGVVAIAFWLFSAACYWLARLCFTPDNNNARCSTLCGVAECF